MNRSSRALVYDSNRYYYFYRARRAMVYDMMYYDTDYRGYYFQPAIDPTALERYKKQLADEEPLSKEKSS